MHDLHHSVKWKNFNGHLSNLLIRLSSINFVDADSGKLEANLSVARHESESTCRLRASVAGLGAGQTLLIRSRLPSVRLGEYSISLESHVELKSYMESKFLNADFRMASGLGEINWKLSRRRAAALALRPPSRRYADVTVQVILQVTAYPLLLSFIFIMQM
ncbi:hypothetical protein EVAR_31648_1 [Eumeta japonica]|uniref:Uncharacterized protein n=1 Tax=Eumeta variegata TaxID=151549 RepID=A0A4C1W1Z9_EUMVA|nr:hypothetical protein EVAR_31648_1 [Eumeta japonica]